MSRELLGLFRPPENWADLTPEQQAAVVSDWVASMGMTRRPSWLYRMRAKHSIRWRRAPRNP